VKRRNRPKRGTPGVYALRQSTAINGQAAGPTFLGARAVVRPPTTQTRPLTRPTLPSRAVWPFGTPPLIGMNPPRAFVHRSDPNNRAGPADAARPIRSILPPTPAVRGQVEERPHRPLGLTLWGPGHPGQKDYFFPCTRTSTSPHTRPSRPTPSRRNASACRFSTKSDLRASRDDHASSGKAAAGCHFSKDLPALHRHQPRVQGAGTHGATGSRSVITALPPKIHVNPR